MVRMKDYRSTANYRKMYGDGPKFKPGSCLIYSAAEKVDYQEILAVTMCFERHTADAQLLEYRYALPLQQGDKAEVIVKRLREAADQIEKDCVKKVLGKE